jgi:hypothetical protein
MSNQGFHLTLAAQRTCWDEGRHGVPFATAIHLFTAACGRIGQPRPALSRSSGACCRDPPSQHNEPALYALAGNDEVDDVVVAVQEGSVARTLRCQARSREQWRQQSVRTQRHDQAPRGRPGDGSRQATPGAPGGAAPSHNGPDTPGLLRWHRANSAYDVDPRLVPTNMPGAAP